MYKKNLQLILAILTFLLFNVALANELAPWGYANTIKPDYRNQKVVYDLEVNSEEHLSNILSRAGLLSKLNGDNPFDTKIIIVIHGKAIPFFSTTKITQYRKLMELAYSQTFNGIIEFRMCSASARLLGLKVTDIHGFVTMVPMADAEIVRLQHKGYSYMC